MKCYLNYAILYTLLALGGGVFFREFTKLNNFTAKTTLSVVHTHYFLLGTAFFLLLLILEKSFFFSDAKTKRLLQAYHMGLNLTVLMLTVRGLTQVLDTALSSSANIAITAISELGHILLGVSLVLMLLQFKRTIPER